MRPLIIQFLSLFAFVIPAAASFPDDNWVRRTMKFNDDRIDLVSCNSTTGLNSFRFPQPQTRFYCFGRPPHYKGNSFLIFQRNHQQWEYFEIRGCHNTAVVQNVGDGYIEEVCDLRKLNGISLQPYGVSTHIFIRTEWSPQGGGISFQFRLDGHSYSGAPMNLFELHQLNQ